MSKQWGKAVNLGGNLVGSVFKMFKNDVTQEEIDNAESEEEKKYLEMKASLNLKGQIYETFNDPQFSPLAYWISMFVNLVIIFSTITFVIEDMPVLSHIHEDRWFLTETICIIIFTFDFLVRLICCHSISEFFNDVMHWIDFIAILPYYIELFIMLVFKTKSGIAALRLIRVVRLARILRIFRSGAAANMGGVIGEIIHASLPPLMVPLYFMALAIVIFGTLIYFVDQPTNVECGTGCYEEYGSIECNDLDDGCDSECYCVEGTEYSSNFWTSIPQGLWWSFVSMTSVGYGEYSPRGWPGRIVGVFTILMGWFFMAMPLAIVGTAFTQAWEHQQEKMQKRAFARDLIIQPHHTELLRFYYAFSNDLVQLGKINIMTIAVDDLVAQVKQVRVDHMHFERIMSIVFEIKIPVRLGGEENEVQNPIAQN